MAITKLSSNCFSLLFLSSFSLFLTSHFAAFHAQSQTRPKPAINILFSLNVLFSHFRTRDGSPGNFFFRRSSYARALTWICMHNQGKKIH